ncbi:bifunctional DNA primase/polymerase [Streptomyces oceani]|uniref:DNA primase n=1 Tax=Streptomyces oceani TaxID=1075402 RepID=A0A1E7JVZ3_9ACTN|nr:bifunctional DNA primase/polymerase [Streptomyces oceani]OEU95480.1 DNA primase [Streptomyces oceani]
MTQPFPICSALLLAASGLPVLPLRAAKLPVGNCSRCRDNVCGGRPNMKTAGPCTCPEPCHGWAAATTDPHTINSPTWARAWRVAAAVAYHPGGAGITVVDLDHSDAIGWARATLPPTRTVPTTRGQHWIYRGTMLSANAVRDGVDIKSRMSYARWISPGTGHLVDLPDAVRALAVKQTATRQPAPQTIPVPAQSGGGECRHRTPAYLERGITMAEQQIREAAGGVHATVYRTFLAVLNAHGRCGCLAPEHVERLFTAAHTKGETARHCNEAWTNARTKLGM